MKKSEEQAIMIESLHRSVAMYRKLCKEQQKTRSNVEPVSNNLQDDGSKDLMVLFEGSQDVSKKAYEHVSERARSLDEELTKLRTELVSLRSERDKAVLEADFAQDRLNGFAAELEHQRKEANSVSLRNAELMHLVVDYEKRLRESSDSMQALDENSRKLSMEVSILKHEKEILVKSEKRALDEVHDLTERVHRLQGMRIVQGPDDFVVYVLSSQREATASFGINTLLIEKYITQPRHIEVQVFGDQHGNVIHLYERDCSLQRRHQKIIEEAPSPNGTTELRSHIGEAAVSATKDDKYASNSLHI